MGAGKRDQRVRTFSFSNATGDGRATSSYAYQGEYFGRVDAPSATEATIARQGEHLIDAIVTLERGISIAPGDLVKADSRYYKVTGVPPLVRRSTDRKLFAIHADDSTFAITGEPA